MTKLQRALLIAHFGAPNHSATAGELARLVEQKTFRTVNLQYGLLGKLLREVMDFREKGQQSYVIAWFERPQGAPQDEWVWHMHQPLAQALLQLGWVDGVVS